MESWLRAVDRVGRHVGSWCFIQRSTCNYENTGETNNIGWMLYFGVCCTQCMVHSVYAVLGVCFTRHMLYSVYAVLGVCCTRCMLVLSVCCTACQLKIMTWRDREGWFNFVFCIDHQQKMKWHSQYSEHFEIQVHLFSIIDCTLAGIILSKIVFITLRDF